MPEKELKPKAEPKPKAEAKPKPVLEDERPREEPRDWRSKRDKPIERGSRKPKDRPMMEHVWICPVTQNLEPGEPGTKSVKVKTWARMLWLAARKRTAPEPGKHPIWKEIGRYEAPTVPGPMDNKIPKWQSRPEAGVFGIKTRT